MKKKEILIIFVLAVLVTCLGWFITRPSNSACLPWPEYFGVCIPELIPTHTERGYPTPYWKDIYPRRISRLNFFVDFLFWFLVLAVGRWVMKRIKR